MPIFSEERGDRNELAPMPYRDDIRVGSEGDGGLDTYYPVRFRKTATEDKNRIDSVEIFRRYSSTGPSAHGDHKAGLASYWYGTDGGGTDGTRIWRCASMHDTYRRTLGGAEIWTGANETGIFFYLRGGGYVYTVRASCPFNLTIYLSETLVDSSAAGNFYAVPRSLGEIDSDGSRVPEGTALSIYGSRTFDGSFRTT